MVRQGKLKEEEVTWEAGAVPPHEASTQETKGALQSGFHADTRWITASDGGAERGVD